MQNRIRLRIVIRGAVQGVGFRPFIYRLATEMGLSGWVNNSPQGVFVEVEGERDTLNAFLVRIEPERPPQSSIQSLEPSYLDAVGFTSFTIRQSDDTGAKTALILPDLAICPDCLADITDPTNRRYRYPFTNCTNCGPRFSIIRSLPYDRPNTTMAVFAMCDACLAEYGNPLDRRFHAQPNACPVCGPHMALWSPDGSVMGERDEAVRLAVQGLQAGKIVAVKGLGGFHLMADARSDCAVRELRKRKRREEKPFAVMFANLEAVRAGCEVSDTEARLLCSSQSPIVLLRHRDGGGLPPSVLGAGLEHGAPRNPNLGVMLPYTPLHQILLTDLGFPVIATSGNLSDEPICTDEGDAVSRLAGIADLFLVHNRPIARHVDDSVVRVLMGRELMMRRARGYAPLPVELPVTHQGVSLSVGAHLKNAVALTIGDKAFVSQHIGDLETAQSYDAFRRVIDDLQRLYEVLPTDVGCDMHPDYLSTKYAESINAHARTVQHHYAHGLSCIAENRVELPALCVAWDGTGYGTDGTVWGGEFLRVDTNGFERVAHMRTFRLPGGDRAVKEPRRSALGLLYAMYGELGYNRKDLAPINAFADADRRVVGDMLRKGLNAPLCSSVGRLFDAVASLCGIRQVVRHEGQAAMELEFAIADGVYDDSYPMLVDNGAPAVIDWSTAIEAIIRDLVINTPVSVISAKFHNGLAQSVVTVAKMVGLERVALSGGCFQNAYLLQRTVQLLDAAGLRAYWHQRVPPNDGGIALGQAFALQMGISCAEPLP